MHKKDIPEKYHLNEGQKNAAYKFMEFLFSNEKEFIIAGAAGVGKTFLMKYIIDNTMPEYIEMCEMLNIKPEYTDVIMTATTNKAAEVLYDAIGYPTSTVHSFFNLTVRDDYASGKTVIRPNNKWMIHQNKIIFIDESSMVDTELWKMLHDGTLNCKLVYVGDRHQLAPVQEDLSPIYKHTSPIVELTEPVRNAAQPALMKICNQLRDTVNTGEFKPIELAPGVIDTLDNTQMQVEIINHFKSQTHDSKILAFTNSRVMEYNSYIRNLRNLPEDFQEGEYLVNNTPLHSGKGMLPAESEVVVLENHGHSSLSIDEDNDTVLLDVDYLDLMTTSGKVFNRVPYPTNREHFSQLSKYYAKQKKWNTFFGLKNDFADLRPRDASTVHKSQGSTYDTVFIDLANISRCNIPSQAARMLYVAFSRAKTRIFLYGDLVEKYGGILQK